MGLLDAEPALDMATTIDRSLLDEVLKEMQ
jgi:hypothetical protein